MCVTYNLNVHGKTLLKEPQAINLIFYIQKIHKKILNGFAERSKILAGYRLEK